MDSVNLVVVLLFQIVWGFISQQNTWGLSYWHGLRVGSSTDTKGFVFERWWRYYLVSCDSSFAWKTTFFGADDDIVVICKSCFLLTFAWAGSTDAAGWRTISPFGVEVARFRPILPPVDRILKSLLLSLSLKSVFGRITLLGLEHDLRVFAKEPDQIVETFVPELGFVFYLDECL